MIKLKKHSTQKQWEDICGNKVKFIGTHNFKNIKNIPSSFNRVMVWFGDASTNSDFEQTYRTWIYSPISSSVRGFEPDLRNLYVCVAHARE